MEQMFNKEQRTELQVLFKRINVSQVCRDHGLNPIYTLQYVNGAYPRNNKMDMRILTMLLDMQERNGEIIELLSYKSSFKYLEKSF